MQILYFYATNIYYFLFVYYRSLLRAAFANYFHDNNYDNQTTCNHAIGLQIFYLVSRGRFPAAGEEREDLYEGA